MSDKTGAAFHGLTPDQIALIRIRALVANEAAHPSSSSTEYQRVLRELAEILDLPGVSPVLPVAEVSDDQLGDKFAKRVPGMLGDIPIATRGPLFESGPLWTCANCGTLVEYDVLRRIDVHALNGEMRCRA